MNKDEALRIALEALEDLGMKHYESTGEVLYKETFTAIKEALAQQHTWIGLDQTTKPDIKHQTEAFFAGVQWAENRLKELNT